MKFRDTPPGSGDTPDRKVPRPRKRGEPGLDEWVTKRLHDEYDRVLTEKIPDDLDRLLNDFAKRPTGNGE